MFLEKFGLVYIDLGHARDCSKKTNVRTGTDVYLAPDVQLASLKKIPYDPERVDVFNIGVVMFIILFQRSPFNKGAYGDDECYRKVVENDFEGFFSKLERSRDIPSEIL